MNVRNDGGDVFETEEKRELVKPVAEALQLAFARLDAVDLSRLAWLYFHLGDATKAFTAVERGHEIDPENEHCERLFDRLKRQRRYR